MPKEHITKLKAHPSHEKGCVTKHQDDYKEGDSCSYRGNGYANLSGAGANKSGLYHHDFTVQPHIRRLPNKMLEEYKIGHKKKKTNLRTPTNPALTKNAWHFGVDNNYKIAYEPFNHNYHHILPATSLHSLLPRELQLIQQSGYNLNDKNNMIILPCSLVYAVAIMLPDHPHGHVAYNNAIKDIVKQLKGKDQESQETHEVKEDNVEQYKQKLLNWEEDEFDEIVKWGKVIAAKGVAELEKNNVNRTPIAQPRS
jgi:hypothetical protein